jgi:hypothetical protein
MFFPVGIKKRVHPHGLPCAGGVDKEVIVHIDADMRVFFPILQKEKEIALPYFMV